MKKMKVESLEDMVFKGRNHDYGAYRLRKKYRKHLGIAMLFGTFFLAVAVAFPLVGAYMNKSKNLKERQTEVVVNIENLKPEDAPMPPPSPPPSPEQMIERVRFVAPMVVDDSTAEGFGISDEINSIPAQPPSIGNYIEIVPETDQLFQTLEFITEKEIFIIAEEQPSFLGGEEARIAFLEENIHYPEEAKELGIQGRVFVTFVVEVDGSITDVKVLRGIGGGCDEEAVRVVSLMPKWNPGKQRGNAVRVQFNLPIKFTLQ